MPRRGENIYKRKDGRWEGRILYPDGKYQYVYAGSYKAVKEKKKKEQVLAEKCKIPPCSTKNAAVLFKTWLDNYANRIKTTTYENYYHSIQNYVIPFFNDPDTKITAMSISMFVKTLEDNDALAKSYKRKILVILKTALREILKGSADYAAILDSVKLPKAENEQVQVFSIKEQRLIENAALHSKNKNAHGIILCFYTGIRIGELCALKWSDIDFDAGIMSISRTVVRVKNFKQEDSKTKLIVGTPKSGKSIRKIPLPDFMLKHSGELKKYCIDENSYILSRKDTPTDPRSYQKLYKRIVASAGVKYRKFHAIRHTFATRALELGVDIKTLSEILGHSSVSITLNIYAHSLMEQKKIAIDKLNQLHNEFPEN